MIDDKTLLWERLKDTATDTLYKDMENKIGLLFDKHKQEIDKELQDYVSWALTRFSTTEIRRAYARLATDRKGLISIIDSQAINNLDKYLEFDDPGLFIKNWKTYVGNISKHPIVNTPKMPQTGNVHSLAKILRSMKKDKRKMKRLVRKEAKLKKRGIRLFDSNEDI